MQLSATRACNSVGYIKSQSGFKLDLPINQLTSFKYNELSVIDIGQNFHIGASLV